MSAMLSSQGKRRSPSEGASDASTPDAAQTPAPTSRQGNKQSVRHRASVACASCRERRIRCVVPEGETECTQCKRTRSECIIKNDDERRRPISKAYMSSLSNRIAMLEEMLKERGVVPPPAIHPPKTRQEAQAGQQEQQFMPPPESSHSPHSFPTGYSQGAESTRVEASKDDILPDFSHNNSFNNHTSQSFLVDPILLHDNTTKHVGSTRRFLCARGSFSDQLFGRSQFFGSTANNHVHARSSCILDSSKQAEQARRAEKVIRATNPSVRDHLMSCFWDHYNPDLQIVDRAAFESDRNSPAPKFFSSFLHITMLAAGFRFAHRVRDDVRKVAVGSWESTLHRDAKSMVDVELERPGGITSVQALLILADLEFGVGRDATGWMYSGMAVRLAFDIGLHVNSTGAEFSETERQVRRQVMTACVLFDRYWSLLLGRPTSIKHGDIAIELGSKGQTDLSGSPVLPFGMINHLSSQDATQQLSPSPDVNVDIHQQLVTLMDLAGQIADAQNALYKSAVAAPSEVVEAQYLHTIDLDRQLQDWYLSLPDHLAWKADNTKSAPLGFFLLHQQYHVCMILLHRPWANYGPTALDSSDGGCYPSPVSSHQQDDSASQFHMPPSGSVGHDASGRRISDTRSRVFLSRKICTLHAVRTARIFWQHRQRFNGRKLPFVAIQHAGTSAIALLAALAHRTRDVDQPSNLRYLQVLSAAIYDMSHIYQPAAKMYHLLKAMLVEIRNELVKQSTFDTVMMSSQTQQHQAPISHMNQETAHNNLQGDTYNNGSIIFGTDRRWSTGGETAHPFIPVQMNTYDSEHNDVQPFKKRRCVGSRSASELVHPMFSLFTVSQSACPTPPKSSGSQRAFGGNNDHDDGRHHSPAITESSEPSPHPTSFELEFLDVMAVDMDHKETSPSAEDDGSSASSSSASGGAPESNITTPPSCSDDSAGPMTPNHLVIPSAPDMMCVDAKLEPLTNNDKDSITVVEPEVTIQEWLDEPSCVKSHDDNMMMGQEPAGPAEANNSKTDAEHEYSGASDDMVHHYGEVTNNNNTNTHETSTSEDNTLEWFADALDTRLEDLVRSIEDNRDKSKAAANGAGTSDPPRNHALDFLTL